MTIRTAVLAFGLVLSATAVAQDLSGTWSAKDVTITLTQEADQLAGTIVTDRKSIPIGGVVDGNEAFGEVSGPGGTMPFSLALTGKVMKFSMTGPDGKALTFFLKRSKQGAPAPAAPSMPAEPGAPDVPDSTEAAGTPGPGQAAAVAGGKPAAGGPWRNDDEGWRCNAPQGWKGGEQKDGSIMLGHDKEWGILRISHQLGARLEEVRAQNENGFTAAGVAFSPTAPIASLKVKAGAAIAGDYRGMTAQGPMRTYTVAIQGPLGVLFVSGMAPASNHGRLAEHARAMAASVAFYKGKAGNAVQHVAGTWWHWRGSSSNTYGSSSSSSSYSVEKKLWLCPDGRFSRTGDFSVAVSTRTETPASSMYDLPSISSASASRDSSDGSDGRWTAIGTRRAGKILVTLNDGTRQVLGYETATEGDKWQIYIDGTGYLYDKDMGGCQ